MTRVSVVSSMKVTWPSRNRPLAAVPCQPKISSLGPQLFVVCQLQAPPPNGILLLLMATTGTPGLRAPVFVLAQDSGLPETPKPLSGSAQRWKCRSDGASIGSMYEVLVC